MGVAGGLKGRLEGGRLEGGRLEGVGGWRIATEPNRNSAILHRYMSQTYPYRQNRPIATMIILRGCGLVRPGHKASRTGCPPEQHLRGTLGSVLVRTSCRLFLEFMTLYG